jgi:hypothetical protein
LKAGVILRGIEPSLFYSAFYSAHDNGRLRLLEWQRVEKVSLIHEGKPQSATSRSPMPRFPVASMVARMLGTIRPPHSR